MKHMPLADIYNFRQVDERLYTSGQPTEAQLAAAASAGIEVVINLALHDDPRYSLPDEPGSVASLGMAYVHIPVAFANPTEADLLAFFHAMEASKDKRTLVHCAANYRVTAFVGLFNIIRRGWSHDEAFRLMRAVWEPNEVWTTFITSTLHKYGPLS